ncbi:MAG: flagellar assembly protein FliW [Lawsonibacter sp.]|nr:flagellar assembly protein FliW [Lawsonibacter sp.]
MNLSTKYFGVIDYDLEDVLSFPKGLFAYEDEHTFLLLPFAESNGTLLCLQSVRTPELAFVAMDPFALTSAYAPDLPAEDLQTMEAATVRELCFYVFCAVKNPVANSTVNLKCPVVINPQTRKAMQVILDRGAYGMRHPLSEFERQGAGKVC